MTSSLVVGANSEDVLNVDGSRLAEKDTIMENSKSEMMWKWAK